MLNDVVIMLLFACFSGRFLYKISIYCCHLSQLKGDIKNSETFTPENNASIQYLSRIEKDIIECPNDACLEPNNQQSCLQEPHVRFASNIQCTMLDITNRIKDFNYIA